MVAMGEATANNGAGLQQHRKVLDAKRTRRSLLRNTSYPLHPANANANAIAESRLCNRILLMTEGCGEGPQQRITLRCTLQQTKLLNKKINEKGNANEAQMEMLSIAYSWYNYLSS